MLGELREELVECTTPHKTPSASRLLPSPELPSLGADFLQDGEGDRQERDQMVQKMREDVERLNGLLSNKDILLDQASHDAQVAAEQLTLVQEKAGRAMAMQSAADEKVLGLQQQVAARDEQLATLSQDIQDAAAARAEAQSRQEELEAKLERAQHEATTVQAEAAHLREVLSEAEGARQSRQQEMETELQSARQDLQRQLDDATAAHAALTQAGIAADEQVTYRRDICTQGRHIVSHPGRTHIRQT